MADTSIESIGSEGQGMGGVEHEMRRIISEVLAIEQGKVDGIELDEPNFINLLGANSIDALEVLITIEERMGFEFPDEDLNPDILFTIASLVERVKQLNSET